jgi:effector-binding domain-containing protein
VKEWATANGVELSDVSWEEYTNDPGEVPPEEYRTQVYWPLR